MPSFHKKQYNYTRYVSTIILSLFYIIFCCHSFSQCSKGIIQCKVITKIFQIDSHVVLSVSKQVNLDESLRCLAGQGEYVFVTEGLIPKSKLIFNKDVDLAGSIDEVLHTISIDSEYDVERVSNKVFFVS